MSKQFLIATDGSPGSQEAVQQGLALAREAAAAVTLVYVRHAPLPVFGDPYYQRALSDELARARVVIEEAADSAGRAGTEVGPRSSRVIPPRRSSSSVARGRST